MYDVFIIEVLIKYAKTFLIKLKLGREKNSEKNIQAKEIYQKVLQSLRLRFYPNGKNLKKSDKKSLDLFSKEVSSSEDEKVSKEVSSSEDKKEFSLDSFSEVSSLEDDKEFSSSLEDTKIDFSSENFFSSEDEYDEKFIVTGNVSGDDNSYRFNLETESFADQLEDNLNLKNLDTQVYFLFNLLF